MLTEVDIFPDPTHTFCKVLKGSILYVGRNKYGLCTKGWIGQVLRVLHCNAGGATDRVKNFFR